MHQRNKSDNAIMVYNECVVQGKTKTLAMQKQTKEQMLKREEINPPWMPKSLFN